MNGFKIGLEANSEDFGFSFMHFYYAGSKSKAKGINNGVEYKRMVRANIWGLETIDFHWSPNYLGQTNIGFDVMPLGIGILRVKTQLNDEDKVKPPLTYLESASNWRQLFLKKKFFIISIFVHTKPSES